MQNPVLLCTSFRTMPSTLNINQQVLPMRAPILQLALRQNRCCPDTGLDQNSGSKRFSDNSCFLKYRSGNQHGPQPNSNCSIPNIILHLYRLPDFAAHISSGSAEGIMMATADKCQSHDPTRKGLWHNFFNIPQSGLKRLKPQKAHHA